MSERFYQRVAVVTGASRGIGAATAIRLAREGANVLVNFLNNQSEADAVVREIVDTTPSEAFAYRADVASWDESAAMIEACVERFGRLDVLVNNAGIAEVGTMDSTSIEMWTRTMAANVSGPFFCSRAAIPHLRAQGGGAIVNVSSLGAVTGGTTGPAYIASKAALLGLTRSMARELAPYGIRVNAVGPGVTDTDLQRSLGSERLGGSDFAQFAARSIPIGRIAAAGEIASAIAFLCSDDASYVAGECLFVTGAR